MKLYYYKHSTCLNFGDDLNPWLFSKLLKGMLDDDENELLIGIGTLLNDKIPCAPKKIIFSSGAGYGTGLPIIDDTWKIYCVRGPLTAKLLKLDKNLAIIDGAVLVRKLYKHDTNTKNRKYSFMPHISTASTGGALWRKVCEELDFGYIDPRGETEKIIKDIKSSEVLITEAMHGAIVAETFRVPWVPVVTNNEIFPFKWHDWCSSIGLEYEPVKLLPLWDIHPENIYHKAKTGLKIYIAKTKLKQICSSAIPVNTKDKVFDNLYNNINTKLYEMIESCTSASR